VPELPVIDTVVLVDFFFITIRNIKVYLLYVKLCQELEENTRKLHKEVKRSEDCLIELHRYGHFLNCILYN
jgi:hypothetical protein